MLVDVDMLQENMSMDKKSEANMNERSVMITENHDINSVEGKTQAASRLETNECISKRRTSSVSIGLHHPHWLSRRPTF